MPQRGIQRLMAEADRKLFRIGENCWAIDRADQMAVIIDADRYFAAARAAMMKATRRIVMIGWDFDARVDLDRTAEAIEGPRELGAFLPWLLDRTPTLEIYLLRWDTGALKSVLEHGTWMTAIRWVREPRLHIRLDGHHPVAASHHQKIVVIDETLAFCGGIDMLGDRWDTREHRDDDPRRTIADGALYRPWHDATTALSGPVAARLGELSRDRWRRSGAEPLAPLPEALGDCWPDRLPVDLVDVDVAISRTIPVMDDQAPHHEIEQLYLDLIASAQHCIYAESQYFASRAIAVAIAKRLAEPDGPEIVIVNPASAEGVMEPIAMDSARARLVQALRNADHHGRFALYHPRTNAGEPIYAHAKILFVDDRLLRLGSSNFNNRSMRLDSECDVSIDAADDAATRATIRRIRDGLLAEHLGVTPDRIAADLAERGSLIGTIEQLRRQDGKTLAPYEVPDLSTVEKWLADNEVLDPEGPDELFEPPEAHGLFGPSATILNRFLG